MTRHQIDPRLFDDSDVTRHLLAARGTQWMRGNRGDPYALLLRAQDIDAQRLHRAMRGRPALRQSEADVWVTVDHALGREILADPRLRLRDPAARRRRRVYGIDAGDTLKHVLTLDDALLARDAADYDRLRELIAAMCAGAAAPRFAARTGAFDVMRDLVHPATVAALAGLAEVPGERADRIAGLSADLAPLLDSVLCPPTLSATRLLVGSYDQLVALIAADFPDGDDRAVRTLLFAVGTELTANVICRAILALAADPAQWAMLRSGAVPAAAVVEETLRWDPPVRMESRIAAEDVTLAGQRVERGAQVVVLVDGANRDPEVFADPDRFDSGRGDAGGNLSLPGGTPAGAVAPAVRLVAAAALGAFAADGRLPVPDGEVVRRMRSPVVHSIARCPVVVG